MLAYSSGHPACHGEERSALLQFKESFIIRRSASKFPFAYPKVASWKLDGNGSDCCLWDGVECDEDTGHVIELDLNASCLYGSIDPNSSLFRLVQLQKLNLANNDCGGSQIPSALGNLSEVTALELSHSLFVGEIPSEISKAHGSLTCLYRKPPFLGIFDDLFLQLLGSDPFFSLDQPPAFLPWSRMSILKLNSNMLQGSLPIPPNSTKYYLISNNSLAGEIPPPICNISSFIVLDLSKNNLTGLIPQCLGNFSSTLSLLSLEGNNLYGTIPQTWVQGSRLRMISLGQNKLQGQIPTSIVGCKMLEIRDLNNNQLIDTFPSWMGTLPELKILILRHNGFHGKIGNPESSFSFQMLQILDLSLNNFTGKLPVEYFHCWIAMQVDSEDRLSYMNAETSVRIMGRWRHLTFLQFFNASHNHLTGPIPRGNQFNTFQKDSFDGNSGLSGEPLSNKCGRLEALPAPAPAPATGDELLVLDWKFVLIGYGSGFVIGAAIGHFVTKRKHDWFMRTFRIRQQRRPKHARRHRN
uniref:Leucine-rich repeat-containing N-terminal plant-type domain-containing protein n=1 Tax=Populus alba TaxID=43335 RepID=A0A4U5R4R5_POPAL|nr:hypothetical protein D5086_0000005500 [Populus alba]